VCGNRTTHVVVPWEEYRDYLAAKMAADSVRVLDDPRTEWVDADDVARRFAADRIASARRARKLTQKQLGRLLGLPQPQISRIERNPDRTTVRVMKRIAKALGVDVSALI
jgi:ribosome-binding protein aMBF1 (putative translation factor)